MNAADVVQLENSILRYIEEHPNAADTVDGIAAWWLNEKLTADELHQVQQALDNLLNSRRMRVRKSADGHAYYSKA